MQLRGLPRFAGGAVGYASYDAVRYTENLPAMPPDDRGLPDLSFAFYDRMVLFDHIRKTILVVAQACRPGSDPEGGLPRRRAPDRRIRRSPGRARARPGLCDIDTDSPVTLQPRSNFTRAEYEAVVRHCQEYIKAGDIFQVVPSQRFAIETQAAPFDIYRVLRVVNPSPFLFYLPYGDFALDWQLAGDPGASRGRDGDDPAAGGDPAAGADEAEDRALAEELLADPKERAEHIMLVDLGVTTSAASPTIARCSLPTDEGRALLARDAHHLERDRPASGRSDRF